MLYLRPMRLVLPLLLVGCFNSNLPDPDAEQDGDGLAPSPRVAVAQGAYQVRSEIQLTIEAFLPEPAENLVVTLRDLSTNPAHTLITLAGDAGVPAVSELRAVLPDAIEGRLEGWIDDEIANVEIHGVPVTTLAATAAALAETTLSQVALESELTIENGVATHRLTALDFAPAGIDAAFDLDGIFADAVSARATASSRNGSLAIGDHLLSLAYGAYAWRAFEAAVTSSYGAGVRETLGAAVDCPRVAATVANKCVLGVCVGHRAQLAELCERGLDEVVVRANAKVTALRLDALQFATGTAQLVDSTHDGIADELAGGVWTARINAGLGLRPVPATFTGAR